VRCRTEAGLHDVDHVCGTPVDAGQATMTDGETRLLGDGEWIRRPVHSPCCYRAADGLRSLCRNGTKQGLGAGREALAR
jgi:hypothetical protein